MERKLDGQQLSQSIQAGNLLNGTSIAALQPVYPLSEGDFERLKSSSPWTATAAGIIFSGVVGYAISLGPKLAPVFNSKPNELTSGDIGTCVAGLVISALLYVVGCIGPNGKKKTMKKIARFFDEAACSKYFLGSAE